MCLSIRLEATGVLEGRLRDLSASEPAHSLGWRFEGRSRLGSHAPRLSLHACDLLADDADWGAATWAMVPSAASKLADSIATLLDELGTVVTIDALWEGEKPTDQQSISKSHFIDLVRRGAFATHVTYLVTRDESADGAPGASPGDG